MGDIYASTAENVVGSGGADVAGGCGAEAVVAGSIIDAPDMPAPIRKGLMAKRVLLSAQLVLLPRTVNGAVVVMQSHSRVGLPWTDMDGRNGKQFSVFVGAVSVKVGKDTVEMVVNGDVSAPVREGGASTVADIELVTPIPALS